MKYLVAFDGTENAKVCLKYISAARLSDDDKIKVIAIWDEHTHSLIPPRLSRAHAKHALADAIAELRQYFGQQVSGECLKGNVSPKILEHSRDWSADFIMLGAHGRTDLPEPLIGNIAREVLHGSRKSVMIFRKNGYKRNSTDVTRILICVDNKVLTDHLFEQLQGIIFPQQSQVRFLHVHTKACWRPEHRSESESLLEYAVERLLSLRGDVTADSLTTELADPASKILSEAKRWQSDFIIMITPAYSPLKRAAIGSVTEQVAHGALCSLQILRVETKSSK